MRCYLPLLLLVATLAACQLETPSPSQSPTPAAPARDTEPGTATLSELQAACEELERHAYSQQPTEFVPIEGLVEAQQLPILPASFYESYIRKPLAQASSLFDPAFEIYEYAPMQLYTYAAEPEPSGGCIVTVAAAVEFDGLQSEVRRFHLDANGNSVGDVLLSGEGNAAECTMSIRSRKLDAGEFERVKLYGCSNERSDGECCQYDVDSIRTVLRWDTGYEVVEFDSVRYTEPITGSE